MATKQYDVIIVGAGPVGLALATELTLRGHTACVVEQNDRIGIQPRAKTTNVRTMTHMRRWGLAGTMRQRSPLDPEFPRRVRFSTKLFGKDIFYFDNAFCSSPQRDDRFPEHAEFIPQYFVEGILLDHVREQPLAEVKLEHRLESFEQHDAGGVTATVRDLRSDETVSLNGRFLVGADGARSTVRKALGITMSGDSSIISFATLILRIPDLNRDLGERQALFHWLVNPEAPCVMGPMDKNDVWFWGKTVPPDTDVDNDTLLASAKTAIGHDYPVEILERDNWTVHRLLADRYSVGDVHLAGDACHLHSPFGGHGMNLGIGDAVDLGWKISAVLDGWADPDILDSYETERKPVHQKVLDTSTENVGALSEHFLAPALDDDTEEGEIQRRQAAEAVEQTKAPEFRSLGVVLGYCYESPNIMTEKGDTPPVFSVTRYTPSAYPGSLAPHAWLGDGSSLYDHFGQGFTLLRLGESAEDHERRLLAAAKAAGMPLEIYAPEDQGVTALYGSRYTLIRPDQHVAWRGEAIPSPEALLDTIRGIRPIPGRMAG